MEPQITQIAPIVYRQSIRASSVPLASLCAASQLPDPLVLASGGKQADLGSAGHETLTSRLKGHDIDIGDIASKYEVDRDELSVVACAGLTGNADAILSQIPRASSSTTVYQLATMLKDERTRFRLKSVDETLFENYGMSLEEFQKRFPFDNTTLFALAFGLVANYDPKAEFLIVGVDGSGGHIFSVTKDGVNPHDMRSDGSDLSFWGIGTGGHFAAGVLATNSYSRHLPLSQSVFAIYCAKKAAEIASGVGNQTDLAFVQNGIVTMRDESQLAPLEKLRRDRKPLAMSDVEKRIVSDWIADSSS